MSNIESLRMMYYEFNHAASEPEVPKISDEVKQDLEDRLEEAVHSEFSVFEIKLLREMGLIRV